MAQRKKSGAARGGRRASGRKGSAWLRRSAGGWPWPIAAIALAGALAVAAGYYVQNRGVFALEGSRQAAEENTVLINEVVSENVSTLVTESGVASDWIEITNAGSEIVEIGRYSLLLDANFKRMFAFPEYSLQPGECLLLYATGGEGAGGMWELPFKLSASGGQHLSLMNAQGRAVDAVEIPELGRDQAWRRTDGGEWAVGRATPGAQNRTDAQSARQDGVSLVPDALELTEAMSSNSIYFPDEDGLCHDYVEIHNASGAEVNLEGWYLSDGSDNLRRWAFPAVALPADGYLAVHCSGLNRRSDAKHLHTDFRISREGERVYLVRPDGQAVSAVEAGGLAANQARSLADGAWTVELAPTPGRENSVQAAGVCLEESRGKSADGVYISEIMASPADQAYDWIELCNGASQAADLSGWGLSDNSDRPRKWQFPAGTVLQPGQYLCVCLSGEAASTLDGFLNADFALSSAGGYTVTLADPEGAVRDAAYLPRQYGGISYGRVPGEQGFFFLEAATPGAANEGAHSRRRAREAEASVPGGLFSSGDRFEVELRAPGDCQIYYTLDCTDPDQGSTRYDGPIPISETTILRTRVYGPDCMPSPIDTQSYLYDVNNGGSAYVISLVSDPDNLFSDSRGIMVRGPGAWEEYPYGKMNEGANFWMDWEREAHVELFQPDGAPALSQGCGVKLHGQFSRATPVKAFKLIARSEYGGNRFAYPIFSRRDYGEYQSFLLRASGQDYNLSFMRDCVLSSLAADTSVMYQESEVGVCYLNGEYYSLFNLRERVNAHSVCQFEGWEGMENEIDLIKANSAEMQGSNESFEELLNWVDSHDMTTQEAYDYLDARIDIQNYIEYMAIENYVGNTDTLNVKRYRNAKADGKWRWVLFDLDWAFNVDTNSLSRWLTPGGMGSGGRTDNSLFIACMKNPAFRERFIAHLAEQMATTFSAEHMTGLFEARYAQIADLLPAYQQRWDIPAEDMREATAALMDYARERPVKMLAYIQKAMKYSDDEMRQYFGAAIEAAQN